MAGRIDLTYLLYLDVPKATGFVSALEHSMVCGTDVTQTKDQSTSLGDVLQARAAEPKKSREDNFLVGPNEVR
jgi:hypothetical protein